MEEHTEGPIEKGAEFKKFAAVKILIWLAVTVAVITGVGYGIRFLEDPETSRTVASGLNVHEIGAVHTTAQKPASSTVESAGKDAGHGTTVDKSPEMESGHGSGAPQAHTPAPGSSAPTTGHEEAEDTVAAHSMETVPPSKTAEAVKSHEQAAASHGGGSGEAIAFPVVGMAFVNAVIQPLDYELNQRFYGWRPNDIVNVTDNVNNFQLGVLEVTRRSAVILAERISRTGSTAAFDPNLENAMNWFMIKADRYWFPAAETKYKAGLSELRIYFNKLKEGKASIYTRTDNLIPLLMAYEDLLGSCDQNLVKEKEDDGKPVSTFKADDYFYYAQGVASAMLTILEAVQQDFNIMVTRTGGAEVLHHAIESCHHAVGINPWIVLNSGPSSIFANHRSNMAAPISHARFYLGVLIKALST